MKNNCKIYYLFFLILPILSFSQTKTSNDVFDQVNSLLASKNTKADVMDAIDQTPREQELTYKFQLAAQNNREWFVNYISKLETGKPIPYHKNFGMSKEEYKEFQSIMDKSKTKIISSGKYQMEILNDGNQITFKAKGKLELLNSFKFNLISNKLFYNDTELVYTGEAKIISEDNALQSKWSGYNWSFEKDTKTMDLSNLENLSATLYKFTLGVIEKTGKTFLHIKSKKVEKGVMLENIDLPLVF